MASNQSIKSVRSIQDVLPFDNSRGMGPAMLIPIMSDPSSEHNTPRHSTDRTEDGKIKPRIKPQMVDMTGPSAIEL